MYAPDFGILVSRAEAGGGVYDINRPEEAIASGNLLELEDFRNSAKSIGTIAALGTRVFKEALGAVTSGHFDSGQPGSPFEYIWNLNGGPNGLTIFADSTITLWLRDYYIKTEVLKDYYDGLSKKERLVVFAQKGSLLVRDVIYDDGEQPELPQ